MIDLNEQVEFVFNDEKDNLTEEQKKNLENAARLLRLKIKLINNVSNKVKNTITDKVAYILNTSESSRNSDAVLAWQYWTEFESDNFNGSINNVKQLMKLTKITSLSRARAKIQNEYELYEANIEVRNFRGKLSKEEKINALETKPEGIGNTSVYIDETGKNQNYLGVGSLWINYIGTDYVTKTRFLEDWKNSKGIKEFHFSKCSRNRLEVYCEFFDLFLRTFTTSCFKFIHINSKGLKNDDPAITDLTYNLISKGLKQEVQTGRNKLPLNLNVYLDAESPATDSLKISNVKERLEKENLKGLYITNFEAVQSDDFINVQMADLYCGAINRKLNYTGNRKDKDLLADFILDRVGLKIEDIFTANSNIDNAKIFHLLD